MRRRWQQARTLTAAEWVILWKAAALLPLIEVGLRVFGLKRIKHRLHKHIPVTPVSSDLSPQIIARIVNGIAGILRARCLARSLALWWLLKRRGIDSQICMGVRKENGALMAHAWVELDNIVLNDRAEIQSEFVPITRFHSDWKLSR